MLQLFAENQSLKWVYVSSKLAWFCCGVIEDLLLKLMYVYIIIFIQFCLNK